MDDRAPSISPHRIFGREEWASLRADTPLTLTADEVDRLRSLNDPVSLDEVKTIYLPISRLLSLYVAATQGLFQATRTFLGDEGGVTPFIIGLAGSVAVGKSTTARLLQALLSRWPNTPRVALVATDGFLFPNAILEGEGLMEKKGFPESYDMPAMVRFLSDVKSGAPTAKAPVYSHLTYDIVAGEYDSVRRPDILILEGLNVLQTSRPGANGGATPVVSDFFDFSIYVDADDAVIESWYVERFLKLRETAFRDPQSYFRRYAELGDADAERIARDIWRAINLPNLRQNILPTRPRADLILRKGPSHQIEEVALRRL
jgi:type I pantothenate kinase